MYETLPPGIPYSMVGMIGYIFVLFMSLNLYEYNTEVPSSSMYCVMNHDASTWIGKALFLEWCHSSLLYLNGVVDSYEFDLATKLVTLNCRRSSFTRVFTPNFEWTRILLRWQVTSDVILTYSQGYQITKCVCVCISSSSLPWHLAVLKMCWFKLILGE
jgi:hypothetical protein